MVFRKRRGKNVTVTHESSRTIVIVDGKARRREIDERQHNLIFRDQDIDAP